jgi:hypothetical protein
MLDSSQGQLSTGVFSQSRDACSMAKLSSPQESYHRAIPGWFSATVAGSRTGEASAAECVNLLAELEARLKYGEWYPTTSCCVTDRVSFPSPHYTYDGQEL